jgi:thiol:disulfide interchange protein DsbD
MGPCLISCLPFLGPVFLASDGGIKKSWKIILPLSLGRLTAYSAFGATVGMAGHYVKDTITTDSVRIVVGCAVLMMGLALLLRRTEMQCTSSTVTLQRMDEIQNRKISHREHRGHRESRVQSFFHRLTRQAPRIFSVISVFSVANNVFRNPGTRTLMPGGLFLMGIGMTLSPCAPLGIVLFSASMTGSAAGGLLLGLSFGLGAIVIPAIAYGIGMAYLGTQLREQLQHWRPKIERVSALLLVAVGISNLARW